ncbi:glycine betaine/L-proline ABC transporter ATP-binding protein [Kineococcus sp. TBRC 1896]|uniref:Glycine betaine/L-proline ABC transporter ATP-binding protein n=1 Tax=Kineococcus mangrovi TaxID=1660183 RepID=A0ABV4I597_9ACTN
MPDVHARGLFKVFGRKPEEAVQRLRDGATAAELRAEGISAAVVDVDLDVAPGEIFVVMGLSGSGKSTLIRMLNGLLRPSAGTVEIDGQDITALDETGLRRVRQDTMSMVFQHFALLPHRTALDNAAYALELRGVPTQERRATAARALRRVGLGGWEDRYPGDLSGGMQQRVGLARALAAGTDLLLMDEAFSALDPLIRREMQDELLTLQEELGQTIVFITHDLNEAMRLGDRVMVMRDGRSVQVGTPQEILLDPVDSYVAQFLADVDRARVLTAADVSRRTGRGDGADAVPSSAPVGRVSADTPLADLLEPMAATGAPITVVDEAGNPQGFVETADVLGALSAATAPPTGESPRAAAEKEDARA